VANGYSPWIFLYPPGTAYIYLPLKLLPLDLAFYAHAVVITLIGVAAGLVGARAFSLDIRVALVAALA
jgi:hypothetical protein